MYLYEYGGCHLSYLVGGISSWEMINYSNFLLVQIITTKSTKELTIISNYVQLILVIRTNDKGQ